MHKGLSDCIINGPPELDRTPKHRALLNVHTGIQHMYA